MARPKQCRKVRDLPYSGIFIPSMRPSSVSTEVILTVDEFEAIKLSDYQGLYHVEGAKRMNVSRQTFGRILSDGHKKVAEALTLGKVIKIEGGHFEQTKERENTMRVAVAVTRRGNISKHLGRSAAFSVFEFEDQTLVKREERENTKENHGYGNGHGHNQGQGNYHGQGRGQGYGQGRGQGRGQGNCQSGHSHGHGRGRQHAWLTTVLSDCQALICGGMGAGAEEALQRSGLEFYVLKNTSTPEEVAISYVEGTLLDADETSSGKN